MSFSLRQLTKKICEVTGIPDYWVKWTLKEIRMLSVRVYAFLPVQLYIIRNIYKSGRRINLIFGCGETSYPGWYGIDCHLSKNVTFLLDLRRRLPFKDGSVDLCYSEHFIEHLWPRELEMHLGEVYRILKPGGRYRIVVPAAFRFINNYLDNDTDFFRLAFPWVARPIDAVRDIIYFAGDHRNVLDENELEYLAKQSGFKEIVLSSVNNSQVEMLRIDNDSPQRIAESLYVEMIKAI